MKIVGVIPARFGSTRLPGKPLIDICGKPMVWWVHRALSLVKGISEVYVVTDDSRIEDACDKYGMKSVMTSPTHPSHIDRLAEATNTVDADFYIGVNGDEPLIRPGYVAPILPVGVDPASFYVANAMVEITNPIDAIDPTNLKIALDADNYALYLSRAPIPFPHERFDGSFMKYLGITCFSKSALQFYTSRPPARTELIESNAELRFIENGKKVKFIQVEAESKSVDTPKDAVRATQILSQRIESADPDYTNL